MSVPGGGSSLDPAAVANREFARARKGYDPTEVRAQLRALADELTRLREVEDELRAELASRPEPSEAVEVFDANAVTRALGDETVRIIEAARDAAVEIRSKAEEHAARVVREAHERANTLTRDAAELRERAERESDDMLESAVTEVASLRADAETDAERIRGDAEAAAASVLDQANSVLEERTVAADAAAAAIRAAATADAEATEGRATELRIEAEEYAASTRADAEDAARLVAERAADDAAGIVEDAKAAGRSMIEEAKAARERILLDLAERRHGARQQLEALRAGRERMLESFQAARASLDEATDEIVESVPRARDAASEAAHDVVADLDDEVAQLDAEIAGSEIPESLLPDEPDAAVAPEAPGTELPDTDISDTDIPDTDTAETDISETELSDADTADADIAETDSADTELSDADMPETELSDTDTGSDRTGVDSDEVDAEPGSHLRLVASNSDASSTSGPVGGSGDDDDDGYDDDDDDDDDLYDDDDDYDDYDDEDDAAGAPIESGGGPRSLSVVAPVRSVAAPAGGAEPTTGVDQIFARLRESGSPHDGDEGSGAVPGEVEVVDDASASDFAGAETETGLDDLVAASMGGAVVIGLPGVGAQTEPGAPGASEEASTDSAEGRERLLDERDAVLESLTAGLLRGLRRIVSDQENEVLDAVRRQRKWKSSDQFLDAVDVQLETCRVTTGSDLAEIIAAGVDFAGDAPPLSADEVDSMVDDVLAKAAEWLLVPVRTRLARVIDRSEDTAPDRPELVDRLRSVYREVRNDRLAEVAGDLASSAFNAGILRGVGGGTVCWVVDNGGLPCPDAEDNQLAGAVQAGAEFPTGDCIPPAHPGCRCLLVPSTR